MSLISRVAPLKNSTRESCPSGSDAVAVSVMAAGATNDVPPVDSVTVGGLLVAVDTVTLVALEVVLPPSASWATAVNAYVPADVAGHEARYGDVVSREISLEPARNRPRPCDSRDRLPRP